MARTDEPGEDGANVFVYSCVGEDDFLARVLEQCLSQWLINPIPGTESEKQHTTIR
jgi:hypothetical protein